MVAQSLLYSLFRISCCLIFFLGTNVAQEKFYNLTVRNGLPSNNIFCTFRDMKGFIWIGTEMGLCRYDGIRFTRYPNKENEKDPLKQSLIFSIYQKNQDEILLLGIDGKIVSYKYSTGKFLSISDTIKFLLPRSISSIYQRKDNTYWLTTDTGLIHVDTSFNLIKEYIIPDKVKGHPTSNIVNLIHEDKNGIFWLGMFYRGLMRFNPKTGEFSHKELEKLIPHVQVRCVTGKPNSETIYAGALGQGVFMININNLSCKVLRGGKLANSNLPGNQITSMEFQNDSLLWIGTQEGLVCLNTHTNKMQISQHNPDHYYSLPNNSVIKLHIDKQNLLWVSTVGGIGKLNLSKSRFNKISHSPERKQSLVSNSVNHFHFDQYGNFWIATAKGIDILAPGSGKYCNYLMPHVEHQAENSEMLEFFFEGNTVWITTWGGGLKKCTIPKNFKAGDKLVFKSYFHDTLNTKSIGSNFLKRMIKDKQGNYWVSSWNGGISRFPKKMAHEDNISFTRINKSILPGKGLASDYTADMLFDTFGVLWIVTGNGLQKLDFENNDFPMMFPVKTNDRLKINMPISIIPGQDKSIWLGTFGGLVKINIVDRGLHKSEIIYQDDDRGIYNLIQDYEQNIWFSTLSSEIGCYNTRNKKLKFYSMTEEVDGADFYFGSPYIDKSGTIYFGSNSGYIYFNPRILYENTTLPTVVLTSIKINGSDFSASSDITLTKEISLDYDERNITLDFAALNYLYQDKNEYKYILEGHDKNWVSLKNSSTINFANLPVGEYILKVIASNNDGYWNWEGTKLKLIIKPPIWGNNYFRAGVVFLLIFFVFYQVRSKLKRLRSEHVQQKLFSKLLIESQEAERKRLSKELHDSLGQNLLIIKNWLDLYQNSEERVDVNLAEVDELIRDAVREVKEISSNLHPHQLERLGLNKAIVAMLKKITDTTGLVIETEIDNISNMLSQEAEINIYRIIQESLNNVLKHAKASKVIVTIQKTGAEISLSIKDNGIGFDEANKHMQIKITDGLGLKSIRERARILDGVMRIETASGSGTAIIIEKIKI
ncbi:MAG: hypothetical protein HYV28_14935 [Ignavibacteriales bacterium]|nr:hypothetical protein [Ignavibacteriales bacterium]